MDLSCNTINWSFSLPYYPYLSLYQGWTQPCRTLFVCFLNLIWKWAVGRAGLTVLVASRGRIAVRVSSFWLYQIQSPSFLPSFQAEAAPFSAMQQNKPSQKHAASHLQNKWFQVLLGPHGKSTPPFCRMLCSPKHPIFFYGCFLMIHSWRPFPLHLAACAVFMGWNRIFLSSSRRALILPVFNWIQDY